MRAFAAVLAVALFSYMGYSKAWSMRFRERLLRSFAKDIDCLCEELKVRPRDIERIAEKLCRGELKEFWQLFSREIASSQRAEDAWSSAVCGFSCVQILDKRERETLLEAGRGIGAKGMQFQIKYMEGASKALVACADELRGENAKKGGMYPKLGFMAGLAAALIII